MVKYDSLRIMSYKEVDFVFVSVLLCIATIVVRSQE